MNTKRALCILFIVVLAFSLCGCQEKTVTPIPAGGAQTQPSPTPVDIFLTTPEPTPAVILTPAPMQTAAPIQTAAPVWTAAPVQTATPVQTAAPFQMPVSTPAQTQTRTNLPVITKNPTDEIVEAGGSCWFVAKYDNAKWAVWHFVSPSGTDYTYDQINTVFPGLEVTKGYASTTQLKNIPADMNGWRTYCRFSNDYGSVDTSSAAITVKGSSAPTGFAAIPANTTAAASAPGAPTVTKSPTDETVEPGGSCWFVAKYENAVYAEWHFVSPDGLMDVDYSRINSLFPGLEVTKGYASTTQLKNIPADMNGWKAYCLFTNNIGTTKSGAATIYVRSAAKTTQTQTPPNLRQTGTGQTTFNQTQTLTSADPYAGTYVCGRAAMIIRGGPQVYSVEVNWGSSYAEHSTWNFSGSFGSNGVLNYTGASRINVLYTDQTHHSDTLVYSDGSGSLVWSNGVIIWIDNKENAADGMSFAKT